MLLDVTIQPVMFVLLFAYVFGGSIAVPGANYREFLLPGIMAQTIVFSSFVVAIGLTNDLEKGIVDRFKSLPISRSVGAGRAQHLQPDPLQHRHRRDGLTGLLIGWRIRNGVVDGVLAFLLLLLFGFSMIWLGIWVGSLMRSVEAVQGFMFTVMFPLTFVANTFAPTETCRRGCGSSPSGTRCAGYPGVPGPVGQRRSAPADAAFPLQHPVASVLGRSSSP